MGGIYQNFRSVPRALLEIIERSYMLSPKATENDLLALASNRKLPFARDLVSELRAMRATGQIECLEDKKDEDS